MRWSASAAGAGTSDPASPAAAGCNPSSRLPPRESSRRRPVARDSSRMAICRDAAGDPSPVAATPCEPAYVGSASSPGAMAHRERLLITGDGERKNWSRRELNPRPTDYESRAGAHSAGPGEPNRAIWRRVRMMLMSSGYAVGQLPLAPGWHQGSATQAPPLSTHGGYPLRLAKRASQFALGSGQIMYSLHRQMEASGPAWSAWRR